MNVPVPESNFTYVSSEENWYPCEVRDTKGNLIYDKIYIVVTDEYFKNEGTVDFSVKSSHKIAMIKTGLGAVKSRFYTWNVKQTPKRTGFEPVSRLIYDTWHKELIIDDEDNYFICKQLFEIFYPMLRADKFITESQKKAQYNKK